MPVEILIVDDSAVQAATRKAILAKFSRSVQTVSSAIEALELFDQPGTASSIRLVITDHCMPGMNGPEFISLMRQRAAAVPVVVLSGLPDAEAEYAGLNVTFRLKPFLPPDLLALVQSLLDEDERIERTA